MLFGLFAGRQAGRQSGSVTNFCQLTLQDGGGRNSWVALFNGEITRGKEDHADKMKDVGLC